MRALLVAMNAGKGELADNLDRHLEALDLATSLGCEVAVFPEMSLTGSVDPASHPERALGCDAPAVARVVAATGHIGTAAVFGIAEEAGGSFYITQIFAAGGVLAGRYRKRFLGEGEEAFAAGAAPASFELDGVRFGMVICAEAHTEKAWEDLAAAGAEVAFLCAAPGLYGRKADEAAWHEGHTWWVGAGLGDACRQARAHRMFVGIATQAGATVDEDFPGLAALVGPTGQVVSRTPDWRPATLAVEIPVEDLPPRPRRPAAAPAGGRDRWFEWLLSRRQGGSEAERRALLDVLGPVRDAVLAHAEIAPGDSVLDVGAGDGLVAFGAAELVGDGGTVVLSDISPDLLAYAEEAARDAGLAARCRFVQAAAEDLSPIADASVDAVTTRSVLVYVADKRRAFEEMHRVLAPGGRVSCYEPINRLMCSKGRIGSYDATPVAALVAKLDALYDALQDPDRDPMVDFGEQDLLAWAEGAGFVEVHLDLRVDVEPEVPRSWEVFADSAANPKVPTLREAMDDALTREEAGDLERHLRPLVESGTGQRRTAAAYLWGRKGA
jgi:predicted amidohydrolase/SAM-dependent methyltransferase